MSNSSSGAGIGFGPLIFLVWFIFSGDDDDDKVEENIPYPTYEVQETTYTVPDSNPYVVEDTIKDTIIADTLVVEEVDNESWNPSWNESW